MKMPLFALAVVLWLGIAGAARAEPRVWAEVQAQDCQKTRYLRAAEVDPSTEVVFEMSWNGMSPGSLAATSDAQGNWVSPIPHALMPCAEGGTVTARLIKGGPPMSTEFEVLLAVATPPPTPPPSPTPVPPVAGTTANEQGASDWLWLSAIGGGVVLLTLLVLLIGPRDDRRRR